MPTKLTDSYIKNLKPRSTTQEIRDAAVTGLLLRVSPKGKRVFYFIDKTGNRTKKINLGVYPGTSLAKARQEALDCRTNLDKGLPADHHLPERTTIEAYWKGWIDHRIRGLKRTDVPDSVWKNHLLPWLGQTRFDALTAQTLLEPVEKAVGRGQMKIAGIILSELKRFLNDAVIDGLIPSNPIVGVKPSRYGIKKTNSDRFLSIDENKQIWNATHDSLAVPILKLQMLTFMRSNEVQDLRWSEIDGDYIRLPAERMKMKLPHEIYITPLMQQILDERKPFQMPECDYVFQTGHQCKALPRTFLSSRYRDLQMPFKWTPHILRKNITHLSRMGVDWVVTERLLAHRPAGLVGVYQKDELLEPRKKALLMWDQFIKDNFN